jgi:hypothetical protein
MVGTIDSMGVLALNGLRSTSMHLAERPTMGKVWVRDVIHSIGNKLQQLESSSVEWNSFSTLLKLGCAVVNQTTASLLYLVFNGGRHNIVYLL